VIIHPIFVGIMKDFKNLLENDGLFSFLKEQGMEKPTEVQAKSITPFTKGESLSVLSHTGSGKTLAYALPLVQMLKADEAKGIENKPGHPRAMILAPTRELATQIHSVLKSISHHCKMRVRIIKGGDEGKKNKALSKEQIDILVCGPGRAKSTLSRKELFAVETKYLIFDEADQLLDMGFSKDIKAIYNFFEWKETQVALFSATMPSDFAEFKAEVFPKSEFTEVHLAGGHKMVQAIETFNINLAYQEKIPMTEAFLQKTADGSGMIFCNQKGTAVEVHKKLDNMFPKKKFHLLHGDMEIAERKKSFEKFKKIGGVLVCTDIAARGIDIETLNWVLNYDLPFEAVYYIHRAGRVGRNGRKGKVFNYVTSKDLSLIGKINNAIESQSAIKLSPLKENKAPVKKAKPTNKKVAKKVAKKSAARKKATSVRKKAKTAKKKTPRYKR
jgi:superfamily II DNA/RNA helicase